MLGVQFGSALYNLIHALVGPPLLIAALSILQAALVAPYGLIWTAHIDVGRLLEFGLKYPNRFHDTHLQRL
jgi:hypothetical protein